MRRRRWDAECLYEEVVSWVPFDLSSFLHGFICLLFQDDSASPVAPQPRGTRTSRYSAAHSRTLAKLTANNFNLRNSLRDQDCLFFFPTLNKQKSAGLLSPLSSVQFKFLSDMCALIIWRQTESLGQMSYYSGATLHVLVGQWFKVESGTGQHFQSIFICT